MPFPLCFLAVVRNIISLLLYIPAHIALDPAHCSLICRPSLAFLAGPSVMHTYTRQSALYSSFHLYISFPTARYLLLRSP